MSIAGGPQQAIKQNPQGALNRALGFLRSGEASQALTLCMQIVKVVPGFPGAWLLLCQLQLELQRPERALDCANRALKLQPGSIKAQLLRAESLVADSQYREAYAALQSLESIANAQAQTLRLVGNLYAGLDHYQDARRVLERSLALDDNDIECRHLYSGVLFSLGLKIEAAEALDEVLRLNLRHGEALLTRSGMQKQSAEHNHIAELQRTLQSREAKPIDTVMIHYALAKEREDTADYADAFCHLQKGGDLLDSLLNYSVERDEAFMVQVTDNLAGKISGTNSDTALGEGIVFIASLPRAGSTLVDRTLASHSEVTSLGETNSFHQALLQHARSASAASKMTFLDALAQIDYASLGQSYLEKIQRGSSDNPVVIDKTPNNIQYLGLIRQALPQAKIIHVHKSPMDACYSIYKTFFSRGYGYSYDLEKLGRYYIAYRRMMGRWRELLPGLILDVSYEQLIKEQEDETSRLLEHCGLDWQGQCMDFHLNSSPTATASVVQVRQPLFHSSVERWRCYEQQLAPLAARLRGAGIEIDKLGVW